MILSRRVCRLFAVFFFVLTFSVQAADRATPAEVVQKVTQAAEFLSTAGEKGLAEFWDKNGRWVWKDAYVWVLRCDKMTDAAHPFNPKLVGKDLAGFKDAEGNYFFVQLCETSKEPNGGWVEYWWPKVGETQPSRKIAYILSVPHQPYQVAAGIHDDRISLEELNKMIK